MARPKKDAVTVSERLEMKYIDNTFAEMKSRIQALEETVLFQGAILEELQSNALRKPVTIHKLDKQYGEEVPPVEEKRGMQMGEDDKITSIRNALRILPPNLRVAGRHARENVTAICGFLVSDEQLAYAYEDFVHEEY